MNALTLYFSPGACSRVPMVLLEEAQADYALRCVSAQKRETRTPAFLQINPKGKVPVLLDGTYSVTENVAIAWHLALRFPEARLLPAEPGALAEAVSLLAWCASGMHPLIGRMRRPQGGCDVPQALPRIVAMAGDELAAQLAIADARLAGKPWLLGDTWCAADACLLWICPRASDVGIEISRWPRIDEHRIRMQIRPAVMRAMAREAAAAETA